MPAVAKTDIVQMEEAIYDESIRAVTEQARVLDAMRSRAGAIAAVANVVTAFVGGLALTRVGDAAVTLGPAEWLAVAFFCVSLGLSVAILVPSPNWIFWHDPIKLLGVYLDPASPKTVSEFRRNLAYYNSEFYRSNGRRLRWLTTLLWLASMFLAAEVVLWLWVLAT